MKRTRTRTRTKRGGLGTSRLARTATKLARTASSIARSVAKETGKDAVSRTALSTIQSIQKGDGFSPADILKNAFPGRTKSKSSIQSLLSKMPASQRSNLMKLLAEKNSLVSPSDFSTNTRRRHNKSKSRIYKTPSRSGIYKTAKTPPRRPKKPKQENLHTHNLLRSQTRIPLNLGNSSH